MKNIEIKIKGLGYKNYYQAYVIIYDQYNNIVYKGMTYNSIIKICLDRCNVYKIVSFFNGKKLVSTFYVDNSDVYTFSFYNNTITFILTDYYYSNLPIERGELLLWQKQLT